MYDFRHNLTMQSQPLTAPFLAALNLLALSRCPVRADNAGRQSWQAKSFPLRIMVVDDNRDAADIVAEFSSSAAMKPYPYGGAEAAQRPTRLHRT
jgi:hypothetical protein